MGKETIEQEQSQILKGITFPHFSCFQRRKHLQKKVKQLKMILDALDLSENNTTAHKQA